MTKPYQYVRFKWGEGVDINKVCMDLSPSFSVEMNIGIHDERDLSFLKDERDELRVRADTLSAILSRFRAVIYQKEAAPFTARDMELRKKVLELYPRNRETPFPVLFTHEPKFETAK